jgi:hypothetical protein
MAIGSSIFDFSTLFRATFLRLCPCNRTRVVDALLASRHVLLRYAVELSRDSHNLQERAAVGKRKSAGHRRRGRDA